MLAELEAATQAIGERARLATVAVRDGGSGRSSSGQSSGIRLGVDRVVTCAHCIRGRRAAVDVGGRTYDAEVERFDAEADVAILKLSTTATPGTPGYGVTMRASARLRPGELVFAFGHPLGARDVLAHGLVRRTSDRIVVSDVPLAPGNSGGPLFDSAGNLVGMNAAIARDRSFSVATETIERVRLGAPQQRLGIAIAPLRARPMFVVTAIEPGSDAERSGIALGDAIVAIDGRAVNRSGAVERLSAAMRLTLVRDGRLRDLELHRRPTRGVTIAA